jgi:opacity protein-like surface antigen
MDLILGGIAMKHKFLFGFLFLVLVVTLIAFPVSAQTPCNLPAELCSNGFNVSVTGAYSNFSGVATNNGFLAGVDAQIAPHWVADARIYSTGSPAGNILQFGPTYYGSLAKILPSTGNFNSTNMAWFVSAGAGLSWSAATVNGAMVNGPKKFAWSVGGGIDYQVSSNVTLRIVDVRYVRTSMLTNGGQFIGNIAQIASGLNIRF